MGTLATAAVGFAFFYFVVAYVGAYLIKGWRKSQSPVVVRGLPPVFLKGGIALALLGYLTISFAIGSNQLPTKILLFVVSFAALLIGIVLEAIRIANRWEFVLIDCPRCGEKGSATKSNFERLAKRNMIPDCAKCTIKLIVLLGISVAFGLIISVHFVDGLGLFKNAPRSSGRLLGVVVWLAIFITASIIAGRLLRRFFWLGMKSKTKDPH